jgi:hypothetical protein
MATLGHQLSQRMAALGRVIPPDCQPLVADLEDRFARVAGVADGQIRYLEGVIEFYKARFPHLAVVVAAMLVISAVLLRWPSDRDGGSRLPGLAEHQIRSGPPKLPSLVCPVNDAVNVLAGPTLTVDPF